MLRFLVPLLLLISALVALHAMDDPTPPADFTFASENEVFTLDPQRMSWLVDMRLAYGLFEGLTAWDTKTFETAKPALAESWTHSPDGLVWTFHLRPDAKWSNGDPVTAHDVVWSWQRLLLPDTAADYSHLLFPVRGAHEFWRDRNAALLALPKGDGRLEAAEALADTLDETFARQVGLKALDDHTLQIELNQPVPWLLDQLAFAPLLPVHRPSVEGWPASIDTSKGWHRAERPPWSQRTFIKVSPRTGRLEQDPRWARPGTLISNGPYVLTHWRYRRDLRMAANPLFHGADPDMLQSIVVRSFPDPNTALLAFESGEVDWLTGVSADCRADLLAQAEAGERTTVHARPAFATDYFLFNCRSTLPDGRPNPFNDARVRRAFALATDKRDIVDHVTNLHEPITGAFTPHGSIARYTPPDGLGFDIPAAAALLDEAGWIDRNGDGLREDESGKPFPVVELLYTTSSPRFRRIAAALRDQWQRHLGVESRLVGQDSKFFGADRRAGNFMVARGRWYGDWGDPTTFLEMCQSDNGNNDAGLKSRDVDAGLALAATQRDPDARMETLARTERLLMEREVPLLPICQVVEVTMYDPARFSGMTEHPRLVQYLHEIRQRRPSP
jgi:oligopeptide transport system substrate-binding protein